MRRWLLGLVVVAPLVGVNPAGAQTDPPPQQQQLGDLFNHPTLGTYPDGAYQFYYGDNSFAVKGPSLLDLSPQPGVTDALDAVTGGLVGKAADKIVPPAKLDSGVSKDVGRSTTGWVAEKAWSFTQIIAQASRAIIGWLFGFTILKALVALVAMASGYLNTIALGALNLKDVIAMAVGLGLAFELIVHRRFARFFVELVVSLAFFAAAMILIAQPQVYFEGLADGVSQAAQIVFRVVDPAHPDNSLNAAQQSMKVVETELPWQFVNFGRTLDGKCGDAANTILGKGPLDNTDNQVRQIMDDAGCQAEAKYNDNPTGTRLAWILLVLVFVLIGLFFIMSAAWGLAKAEFGLAWHFIYGALALLFGSMKLTREAARSWGRQLWGDLLGMILPAVVLGLMLLADSVMLVVPDVQLGFRLLIVCAINAAIFLRRRQTVNAIAAKLSGGLGAVKARKATVEKANVQRQSMDYMPGHRAFTLPLVAASTKAAMAAKQTQSVGQAVGGTASKVTKTVSKTTQAVASGGASVVKDVALGAAVNVKTAAAEATGSSRQVVGRAAASVAALRPREMPTTPGGSHETVVAAHRRAGVDKRNVRKPEPHARPEVPVAPLVFAPSTPEPEVPTSRGPKADQWTRARERA